MLYDLGTGLEVLSPLCPHLFLEVAGLGNFAKVINFCDYFAFTSKIFLLQFTLG